MGFKLELSRIPIIGAVLAAIVGIVLALNNLESNWGIVDWLIMKVAPALPSQLGDLVILFALFLFLHYFGLFEKALDKL